jgi:hypothetical protein
MEKLIAAYSKITEVMPRFDRLSEAFKKDQTLHRVMAMAYTDILDFHREAYGFFSQPGKIVKPCYDCLSNFRRMENFLQHTLG